MEWLDRHYQKPRGIIGWYIGEKMVQQHLPETFWTIKLLNLQKDDRVLELGCGAGYAIKALLKNLEVNHAKGLDLSQSILRSAAIRNRKEIKKGRAGFIQGNVRQLAFQDAAFDKIFSIHSIYFWENLPETLSEIYRVLTPGGSIVLTLCNGKNGTTWNNITTMLEQKVIPILNSLGFNDVKIVDGPDSRQFQTVAVLAEKIRVDTNY